jgi:hypothetical protein
MESHVGPYRARHRLFIERPEMTRGPQRGPRRIIDEFGRGERIRTSDLVVPNHAL